MEAALTNNKSNNWTPTGVPPQKFALWLGMASIVMFFSALTSALIVASGKVGSESWVQFTLPSTFYVTTGIIIISSITLQTGLMSYRTGKKNRAIALGVVTLFLGLGFVSTQVNIGMYLHSQGLDLVPVSSAFLWVIAGAHAIHITFGMIFLIINLVRLIWDRKKGSSSEDLTKKRTLGLELITTYWHFMGILWVYLFVFFNLIY